MLEVFPLNQIADGRAPRSKDPTLISREIILEEFLPMITVPNRYTPTDGRTIYDSNTELCTKVHRAVKIGPYSTPMRPDRQAVPMSQRTEDIFSRMMMMMMMMVMIMM